MTRVTQTESTPLPSARSQCPSGILAAGLRAVVIREGLEGVDRAIMLEAADMLEGLEIEKRALIQSLDLFARDALSFHSRLLQRIDELKRERG